MDTQSKISKRLGDQLAQQLDVMNETFGMNQGCYSSGRGLSPSMVGGMDNISGLNNTVGTGNGGGGPMQGQLCSYSKEYVDAERKVLRILNQRYELKEELGKGAHGRIFSGRDKVNKQLIAVKIMEKVSKNKSKFMREISLMKEMNKNNQPGFPRLIYHSSDKNNYYIVMELLPACIKDLKDQMEERQFSIKTVTMIGLQLLQRLESIHKFGFVHRDLKPANMMVGKNGKGDLSIIYLIDFGLTKKQAQVSNIPHADGGNKVVGTAVYAAINAHLPGSNYYKKDDLESMMYVLCYLATGNLPWKNFKPTDVGLEKMMKLKMKMSPYDLFHPLPMEYAQITDHIKTSAPESPCDYRYIEGLLKQVAYNQKFKLDYRFDWLAFSAMMSSNNVSGKGGVKKGEIPLPQQQSATGVITKPMADENVVSPYIGMKGAGYSNSANLTSMINMTAKPPIGDEANMLMGKHKQSNNATVSIKLEEQSKIDFADGIQHIGNGQSNKVGRGNSSSRMERVLSQIGESKSPFESKMSPNWQLSQTYQPQQLPKPEPRPKTSLPSSSKSNINFKRNKEEAKNDTLSNNMAHLDIMPVEEAPELVSKESSIKANKSQEPPHSRAANMMANATQNVSPQQPVLKTPQQRKTTSDKGSFTPKTKEVRTRGSNQVSAHCAKDQDPLNKSKRQEEEEIKRSESEVRREQEDKDFPFRRQKAMRTVHKKKTPTIDEMQSAAQQLQLHTQINGVQHNPIITSQQNRFFTDGQTNLVSRIQSQTQFEIQNGLKPVQQQQQQINVTVNIMQQEAGTLNNAIGGGTLGIDKQSQHSSSQNAQPNNNSGIEKQTSLQGGGNIVQIVLFNMGGQQDGSGYPTGGSQGNGQIRNVQVHISGGGGPNQEINYNVNNQGIFERVVEDPTKEPIELLVARSLPEKEEIKEEAPQSYPIEEVSNLAVQELSISAILIPEIPLLDIAIVQEEFPEEQKLIEQDSFTFDEFEKGILNECKITYETLPTPPPDETAVFEQLAESQNILTLVPPVKFNKPRKFHTLSNEEQMKKTCNPSFEGQTGPGQSYHQSAYKQT